MPQTMLQVSGLKGLERDFKRLPRKMTKKVVNEAMKDGARVIQQVAVGLVPVDEGNLKKATASSKAIREAPRTRERFHVQFLPDYDIAPHAHLVEFGTVGQRRSGGGVMANKETGEFFGRVVGPMPAQPFIRPAFDSQKDRAVKVIDVELWARIKTAMKGL